MNEVTLKVDGMNCGACVKRVTDALASVPGVSVRRVEVGSATVARDPARVSEEALMSALASLGYRARKEGCCECC